jgi:DNA repair exonuclease SbcCD ATPase subunit
VLAPDLSALEQRVRAARTAVDREVGEARAVGASGRAAMARAASLREAVELHDRVTAILTGCGEERQQHAQRQLEQLVTRGLQVIFDEGLSFRVVQSVRRGQANVDFVVSSAYGGSVVETSVMDARGGGMAAVAGFLLRLVVLLLTPGARRLLVLDESFAHVSAEYRPRLAEFLREVTDKAGVQLILVTHDPEYGEVADACYRLSPDRDGVTEVTTLSAPPGE